MTAEMCYALVYLAEGLIVNQYFGHLYPSKRKYAVELAAYFVMYILLYIAFTASNVFLNVSSFFVGNTVLALFCYAISLKAALLHAAFLSFAMTVTELLTGIILSFLFFDYSAYSHNVTAIAALAVCSKLLFFFVTYIAALIVAATKERKEELRYTVLLCVMPLASMLVSIDAIYINYEANLSKDVELMTIASLFLLLASNILVMLVYNKTHQLHAEHMSLKLQQQKDLADAEYYKMLNRHYEDQRLIVHDIRNHYSVIRSYAQEGGNAEIVSYVDSLIALPELGIIKRYCQQPALNAILLHTAQECEMVGVDFDCSVSVSPDFLSDVDASALFGNLLSNAYEAARVSEGKFIEFAVHKPENTRNVMITLVNACDQAPQYEANGTFRSGKANKVAHGLGQKSIQKVVKKYHGEMEAYYSEEDRSFHVIITVPLD